jgi:hypothetical protein
MLILKTKMIKAKEVEIEEIAAGSLVIDIDSNNDSNNDSNDSFENISYWLNLRSFSDCLVDSPREELEDVLFYS